MARLPKPIRDPVYDYIYITPIEQHIIDRPEFQRLRFILQNSSAYLTYPSNNNSRFLHSLGVMHLAGELFLNGLANAAHNVRESFIDQVYKYLLLYLRHNKTKEADFVKGWDRALGNVSHLSNQASEPVSCDKKHPLIVNLVWQAVRLAALIHDVGHFPLSHVFEYAFIDFITYRRQSAKDDSSCKFQDVELEYTQRLKRFREAIDDDLKDELPANDVLLTRHPLHEMWGTILFESWCPSGIVDSDESTFYKVVFRIANVISIVRPDIDLSKGEDKFDVFRCLHALVAGELDADRLDYCVRDPHSSALELGAIDVSLIVRSMTLVDAPNRHGMRRFRIMPNAKALPALEAFFHQRYLIYQYLIYHHNVVRLDAVAQEIVFRLLEEVTDPKKGSPLEGVLEEFGLWTKKPNSDGFYFLSLGFEYYDDAWLRTLMARCLIKLKAEEQRTAPQEMMVVLLETFLYRQTRNVFSMWKREADYDRTIDEILRDINDPTLTKENIRSYLAVDCKTWELDTVLFKPVQTKLAKKNVFTISRVLTPKVPSVLQDDCGGHSVLEVLVDGKPKDFRDVSSYLRSLSEKQNRPTVFIAFVGRDLKEEKNEELLEECKNCVKEELRNFVRSRSNVH